MNRPTTMVSCAPQDVQGAVPNSAVPEPNPPSAGNQVQSTTGNAVNSVLQSVEANNIQNPRDTVEGWLQAQGFLMSDFSAPAVKAALDAMFDNGVPSDIRFERCMKEINTYWTITSGKSALPNVKMKDIENFFAEAQKTVINSGTAVAGSVTTPPLGTIAVGTAQPFLSAATSASIAPAVTPTPSAATPVSAVPVVPAPSAAPLSAAAIDNAITSVTSSVLPPARKRRWRKIGKIAGVIGGVAALAGAGIWKREAISDMASGVINSVSDSTDSEKDTFDCTRTRKGSIKCDDLPKGCKVEQGTNSKKGVTVICDDDKVLTAKEKKSDLPIGAKKTLEFKKK